MNTNRRDYLSSYEVGPGGCWLYTGSINNRGYGTILGRGAHRWFYERLVGPIPDGLVIDHLCRVPRCVNPEHLEPVTTSENNRRAVWPEKSPVCRHGHERDPKAKRCKTCQNNYRNAWRRRKREEALASRGQPL